VSLFGNASRHSFLRVLLLNRVQAATYQGLWRSSFFDMEVGVLIAIGFIVSESNQARISHQGAG